MDAARVAFVLTAHMPYLRAPGRSYLGEEPLHELTAFTLIPTITTLHDLHEQGMQPRVGLAYSPLLLEQLADPVVQKHFGFWLEEWMARLDLSLAAFERAGDTPRVYLARFYREWAEGIQHSFDERFGRNLVAALRELCDEGVIEPLVSPATYAYLQDVTREELLRAQLELGALVVARRFGRKPKGLWPPGLSYRADANALVTAAGVDYVVLNPAEMNASGEMPKDACWLVPHRLAALPYDARFDQYLHAEDLDYRGDPLYLSPQREADGFAWSRNGLTRTGEPYDPYDAFQRVQEHATHFVDVLAAYARQALQTNQNFFSLIPLDGGFLGGQWFEGVAWLRAVLPALAQHPQLALAHPSAHPRAKHTCHHESLVLQHTSSEHETLMIVHAQANAEERLIELVRRFPDARDDIERVLQQAARELLLAQSGDQHAIDDAMQKQRALRHLARCVQLCDLVEHANLAESDLTLLETLEEEDNPFAYLNYRVFGS